MSRITFSGENVSLSYIWEWYQVSEKAMRGERKRVLDALTTDSDVEDFFVGMTGEDVDGYFQEYKRELEFLVCETGWPMEGTGSPNLAGNIRLKMPLRS